MLGAALNTGNNLLHLLAALLLSAVPVSGLLARRALRELRVELLLPAETTVGARATAALRLTAGAAGAAGLSLSHEGEGGSLATLAYLEPGATVVRTLELESTRRGPVRVRTLLESLFPWGLLVARKEGPAGEMLVLPRPVQGAAVPAVESATLEGRASLRPGRSEDLLEIRDHRHGDDARRIDWKATARRDRLMVRLGSQEEDRRASVIIDPSPPPGEAAAAEEAVELAISRAAGAVVALARQGWLVRLVTPDGECRGSEVEQLRALARLVVPEAALPTGWWRARLPPGEAHVVCRAGARS